MTTEINTKEQLIEATAIKAVEWNLPKMHDLNNYRADDEACAGALVQNLRTFELRNKVILFHEAQQAFLRIADTYYDSSKPMPLFPQMVAVGFNSWIEDGADLDARGDSLDWELPNIPDLADFEYGSDEETAALDAILSAFEKVNGVELGWEARNAWEEVARVYYNSIS